MDLIVLGAGPAYSDRAGAVGAAYLVRHGDDSLLLDLGHGAFANLAREIEPSRLTAIAISHLHPDHFIDLVPLRHYLRYEFKPPRRMRVLAPPTLSDRLDALHAEPGFTLGAMDVTDVTDGVETIGPFAIEARPVSHTESSFAFRVSIGGSSGLVYSGDCGDPDDLVPLIRPGDVVLTEVSFGPGPVPADVRHLDGPGVGRVAAATHPSRVLLSHLLMGFDADRTVASVQAVFDGDVRFVWPGDRLRL